MIRPMSLLKDGVRFEVCDPCGALHIRPLDAAAGACIHGVTRVMTDEEVDTLMQSMEAAQQREMARYGDESDIEEPSDPDIEWGD